MLTAHRLRKLLSYSKSTGLLRWRERLSHRTPVGSVAGSINADGLCVIQIEGKKYLAHRLAVQHVTGHPPANNMKFRNGNKCDTRWSNIRA